MIQGDLFASALPTSSPVGLTLSLRFYACRGCGAADATVGASKGPHFASLHCRHCGAFRGWLPGEVFHFVTGIIDTFGQPVEPIVATLTSADM